MPTNKKATASGGRATTVGNMRQSPGMVGGRSKPPRYAGGKNVFPLVKNSLSIPVRVTVIFHNSGKANIPAQGVPWDLNPGEEYDVPKALLPYVRYVNIEEVENNGTASDSQ